MKNKLLIALSILILSNTAKSQSCFETANSLLFNDERELDKRAVVRIGVAGWSCTATFINRNTSDENLGNYFVTAWHCFKLGSGECDGDDFDFENENVRFHFNYQSPNSYETDTVFYNAQWQGQSFSKSTNFGG